MHRRVTSIITVRDKAPRRETVWSDPFYSNQGSSLAFCLSRLFVFPSSLCWSPWYVGGALLIVGTLHFFVCLSCVVPAFSFFFLPFVGVPGVFGTGGASVNAPTSLFVLSSFLLLSPRFYFPFVPLFESLGCHGLSHAGARGK